MKDYLLKRSMLYCTILIRYQANPYISTVHPKIICDDFFALNFIPGNFPEWFLSLKVDIKLIQKTLKTDTGEISIFQK